MTGVYVREKGGGGGRGEREEGEEKKERIFRGNATR